MQKISLVCQSKGKYNFNDGVYFHGWLMSQVSEEFADKMHQTGVNPVTIVVYGKKNEVIFSVALLTDEAVAEVAGMLMDDTFTSFSLKSTEQCDFKILRKVKENLESKDLAQVFYQQDQAERLFQVNVMTPLAFKSNGTYYNLPDIRLFFQSIMKKYNAIFENTEHIDLDLLDEICSKVNLVNFRINSRRFYIHKAYINGFCGRLVFYCKGAETLSNYVAMLLRFAEFSSVGVKTSLGMGSIAVNREENNG